MDAIDEELMEMEQEASTSSEQRSVYSVLRDHSLLLPVVLVILLMGCQQLSGLNAVSSFATITVPNDSFALMQIIVCVFAGVVLFGVNIPIGRPNCIRRKMGKSWRRFH